MKQFFIHNPLFILLCPLFNGVIIYMLILLIYNDIANLQEHFLDLELFLCIGLAFITQELTRQVFLIIEKKDIQITPLKKVLMQMGVSIISVSLSVGIIVSVFFKFYIGFSASLFELSLFIGIYSILSLFFLSLLYSYRYLHLKNTTKIHKENLLKEDLKRDFNQFKKGINPDLLFESLEALVVMIKKDDPQSDDLIDQLAIVYRYILSKKAQELVPFEEEVKIAKQLVKLFSHLPFTKIQLKVNEHIDSLIIPGTLLKIIELIIHNSMQSEKLEAEVNISDDTECILIDFNSLEKLTRTFTLKNLSFINSSYKYFSNKPLDFVKENGYKRVKIPKLKTQSI